MANMGIYTIPDAPAPDAQNQVVAPPPAAPIMPDQNAGVTNDVPAAQTPMTSPVAPLLPTAPMSAQPIVSPLHEEINKTTQTVYNPADVAAVNAGMQNQSTTGKAELTAQQQKDLALAEAHNATAQNITQENKVQLEAEEKRQQEATTRLQAIDQFSNDLKTDIDPNRLYANASTPSKVLAGIGLFFGGLSMAFGNKNNAALDIINKAIDQDIDAQKASIANQQTKLAGMRMGFGQYLNLTNDERTAELAERRRQQELALEKVQQITAQSDSDIVKAKGAKFEADMQTDLAKTNLQLHQRQVDSTKGFKEKEVMPKSVSPEVQQNQDARSVVGFKGLAPDAESARAFRTENQHVIPATQKLDRVIDLLKNKSMLEIKANPKTRNLIQQEINQVQNVLTPEIIGKARFSDFTKTEASNIVNDPTSWLNWTPNTIKSLEQFRDDMKKDLNTRANIIGLTPSYTINNAKK